MRQEINLKFEYRRVYELGGFGYCLLQKCNMVSVTAHSRNAILQIATNVMLWKWNNNILSFFTKRLSKHQSGNMELAHDCRAQETFFEAAVFSISIRLKATTIE